jgi:dTDP-4-dehydrorhamnose 3,5-epimerase
MQIWGVRRISLNRRSDIRGSLVEAYRQEGDSGIRPVQWNVSESNAGVLRGVHAHWKHTDYLFLIHGVMRLGLYDLRRSSPSFRRSEILDLSETPPVGILIPPGVAHGFCSPASATLLQGVTEYWDPADELGCHCADPDLHLAWNVDNPILSERDSALPPLRRLIIDYETSVHAGGGAAVPEFVE